MVETPKEVYRSRLIVYIYTTSVPVAASARNAARHALSGL